MEAEERHAATVEREGRRVLRHLGRGKLQRIGAAYVVNGTAGGKARLSVHVGIVASFLSRGWVAQEADGRFGITGAGEAWLRRAGGGERRGQGAFRAQHGEIERSAAGVRVEQAATPLDFLKRFRTADGAPFLSAEQAEAANRLEADFELAQLRPRMTQDFSAPVDRLRRVPGTTEHRSARALDARRRCLAALDAAGPGLADLLFETVCMARGLNEAERGFGWPARAGKAILKLGLDRLAAHYGLISGGRRSGRIETWIAEVEAPEEAA